MKRHPTIYLLAAALAAVCISASAGTGCDTNAKKRTVVGQQPTANALYARIHGVDMGAWDDGFSEETFTYIGEVHTKAGMTYKIGYLKTIFGQSCRGTPRLYIFDDHDQPLGHYYGIIVDPRKIKISGEVLHFPFDANDGNTLDLGNGPPKRAWLDGDNPDWNPVQPNTAPPAHGMRTLAVLHADDDQVPPVPDPGTAPPPPDPGTAPPPPDPPPAPDPGTAPPAPDPGTAPPPPDPGTAPPPPL